MKRCPNYIKENIRKTNAYMYRIVELNIELENNIKKLNINDDPDYYLQEHKWWPGYCFADPEYLIEEINKDLSYNDN